MNLKHLTDKILLLDTKRLVASERKLTGEILHHLREIEARKLYSDLKYKSMYDYCLRELGYSEGTAYRRISAARLLNDIPEVEAKLKDGSLNLTNVATLVQFFKENDIQDPPEKRKIIAKVEGLSRRETELKLMQLSDKPTEKKEAIWLSLEVIQRLKDYRTLKGTSESLADVIQESVTIAMAELEKSKFRLVKNPREDKTSSSRTPTASVKREVYQRDKVCVKCGGKFHLQFDHRRPFALGGKSTPENIRLLCFNCNQRERIRQRL